MSDLDTTILTGEIRTWFARNGFPKNLEEWKSIDQFFQGKYENDPARLKGIRHLIAFYSQLMAESGYLSPQKILISIHGIRTTGKWQKQLTPFLNKNDIVYYPYDYDWFNLVSFISPTRRAKQIEGFVTWYINEVQRHNKGNTPSLIAHSFGTLIATEAMKKYPDVIQFDRIIFCGAIVEPQFSWGCAFSNGQVKALLNEFSRGDIWARVARFIIAEAGPSGAKGFTEKHECLFQHEYPLFSHSDYFNPAAFEKKWIPFLSGKNLRDITQYPIRPKNKAFIVTVFVLAVGCFGLLYLFAKFIHGLHW